MKHGRPTTRPVPSRPEAPESCSKCRLTKPRKEFYPDNRRKRGVGSYCKACHNETCKVLLRRERRAALLHYSGGKFICACCFEFHYEFLNLDHVNGGGGQHRKELRLGSAFYRYLRQQGWPKGYRVLCYNCNFSKGFYGYCPHGNC